MNTDKKCEDCNNELKIVNDDQWGIIMDLFYYCFTCDKYKGEANQEGIEG